MGWHVGSRNRTPSGSVGCTNLPGPAGPSRVRRTDDRFRVGSATAAVLVTGGNGSSRCGIPGSTSGDSGCSASGFR